VPMEVRLTLFPFAAFRSRRLLSRKRPQRIYPRSPASRDRGGGGRFGLGKRGAGRGAMSQSVSQIKPRRAGPTKIRQRTYQNRDRQRHLGRDPKPTERDDQRRFPEHPPPRRAIPVPAESMSTGGTIMIPGAEREWAADGIPRQNLSAKDGEGRS